MGPHLLSAPPRIFHGWRVALASSLAVFLSAGIPRDRG
jgi:hypothetical protein